MTPCLLEFEQFHSRECNWKYRMHDGGHFVSALMCYDVTMESLDMETRAK